MSNVRVSEEFHLKRISRVGSLVQKLRNWLQRIGSPFFSVVLFLVIWIAPFVDYACKRTVLVQAQPLLFPLSITIAALTVWLGSVFGQRFALSDKMRWIPIVLSSVILMGLQVRMVRGAGFVAGWDVASVTSVNTWDSLDWYFSRYPNNLFLAGCFNNLAKIGALLNVSTNDILTLGGCACVAASIALCTAVADTLFGLKVAVGFNVLASLYLGLNAWVLVPYSDTYGMLFTSLALYSMTHARGAEARLALVTFFSALGYAVKPMILFVIIAYLIVLLARHATRVASLLKSGVGGVICGLPYGYVPH